MKSFFARLVLGAASLSLLAYVPYRYAVRPPHFGHGFGMSLYTALFPFSVLLAVAGLVAAARPALVEKIGGWPAVARGAIALFGLAWLAAGMGCLPRMAMRMGFAPMQWTIAILQMTAQHVLLGLTAAAAAWRPDAVFSVLSGRAPAGGRAEVEDQAVIG